jgi:hypothetical protein
VSRLLGQGIFSPSRPIPVESSMSLTPSLQRSCYLNVCSLGWVIESNTLRSVTSVFLSFVEPANRYRITGRAHRPVAFLNPLWLSVGTGLFTILFRLTMKTHQRGSLFSHEVSRKVSLESILSRPKSFNNKLIHITTGSFWCSGIWRWITDCRKRWNFPSHKSDPMITNRSPGNVRSN